VHLFIVLFYTVGGLLGLLNDLCNGLLGILSGVLAALRGPVTASAKRFPLLPPEEEGRLNDMPLHENFIERVLPVAKGATGPTAESSAFRLAVCLWQTARPHGPECWARRPRPAAWSSSTPPTS